MIFKKLNADILTHYLEVLGPCITDILFLNNDSFFFFFSLYTKLIDGFIQTNGVIGWGEEKKDFLKRARSVNGPFALTRLCRAEQNGIQVERDLRRSLVQPTVKASQL